MKWSVKYNKEFGCFFVLEHIDLYGDWTPLPTHSVVYKDVMNVFKANIDRDGWHRLTYDV